ncbi:hypothetical protein AC1031_022131 [Aphanomyces cochlioides]|nr:hypothetical protein AC1031_022131 [Aphanomyces cochlioides]
MVKFFYNMAFLFKLMVNKSNRSQGSQVFIPYQPVEDGIRTIELLDTGFKRKYVNIDSTDNCRRLFKIYQTLESITNDIPERSCLQTVSRLLGDNSEFSVWLAPLGLERKPNNEDEVKNCLYCILTALKHWHSYDYCHGDIRWPNIVYVPGDHGYWILIDMDESYPNASKKIDWNHVSSDEILTFQHDLYQLGKLFDGFTCVPATIQQAIDECLNSRGSSTSATSLLDRYFLGQSE